MKLNPATTAPFFKLLAYRERSRIYAHTAGLRPRTVLKLQVASAPGHLGSVPTQPRPTSLFIAS